MSVLTLAFGLGTSAFAIEPDPWTTKDTLWEVAYAGLVLVDCKQSCKIQEQGRIEQNPFLPRCPNPRTMRAICAGSVLGHVAVSYLLPAKWRRRFQVGTVFLEAVVVQDNYYRAGIRIKF